MKAMDIASILSVTGTLVAALYDGDNPCQSQETFLSLEIWLYIRFFVSIYYFMWFVWKQTFEIELRTLSRMFYMFGAHILFKALWANIGTYILFSYHYPCLSLGTPIGLMTLIELVWMYLTLVTFLKKV
jgi:hypothetical protein